MATASWKRDVTTSSGTGRLLQHDTLATMHNLVRARIPKYSTISSYKTTWYVKETTNKVGSADFRVYFGFDDGSTWEELYNGNGVIPKNNGNYLSVPVDLTEYATKSGATVGQLSCENATRYYSECKSSLLSRTYNRYYEANITYTPPTFTIKTVANSGGTVSGGGTFNVAVDDQTKQITATPNSGYKFVKWVDSNNKTYSGDSNKTLNITISEDSISAHSTTVTYTAYFEKLHTHSYTTETSRTPSTCYTKGSVTKKCSCGETQTTELALDPNNHAGGTEVKNAKAATCTATGYSGDTYCKGCGAKIKSGSTIAKLSHTETTISAVAPTCTATGLTAGKKCSVCGTVITAQQTVPATGHSYSTSLTAEGRKKYACHCGHSYIERPYDIGLDNLFSFADWAESSCAKGSGSGSGSVAYNITNGTITLSGSGDFYTAYDGGSAYYCVPVTAGQEYIFRYDSVSTGGKQAFVFFYDSNSALIAGAIHNGVVQTSKWIGKYDGSHIIFTVPNGCVKVGIRLGLNGTGEATYSNIAIYKTSVGNISNRQYRKSFFVGETVGSLYTPVKTGYSFEGWFTGENGAGSQVTSSLKFSQSTPIHSKWVKLPPEFTSASMTYLNKQISSSNKVICNEGFIISVGVT